MSEHRLCQGCGGDSGSRDQELWVQGQSLTAECKTVSTEMGRGEGTSRFGGY